jgi:hypothetical protein
MAAFDSTGRFRFAAVLFLGLLSISGVFAQTNCVPKPSGLVGWWPGDGFAADAAGTNSGTLQGGSSYATGQVGQAFSLNGANGYVQVPDSPLWAFGTNDFSIELWADFANASGLHSASLGFNANALASPALVPSYSPHHATAINPASGPSLVVSTTQSWQCRDWVGGDPNKPSTLRAP